MKLTSNWSHGKVFWRTFTKQDTVYMFGLLEGFLSNGDSMTYENPTGFFQMELKRGDIFGPFLNHAGHVYSNDDEYILGDDGKLSTIEDSLIVTVDPVFKFQFCGSITQFFTAGGADSTIKLTSTLTQTTSNTNNNQTNINSSATDETGASIGGEVSASGKINEITLGAKVNGNVSSKVTNQVSKVVSKTLNVQMQTTQTNTSDQTITLKAGKLTAITSSWQRRFIVGTVAIGHDTYSYEATIEYMPSRQIGEYNSSGDLPPELLAEYKAQHPDSLPTGALAHGDNMQPGELLTPGNEIKSADGRFRFIYQTDANLVLYFGDTPLWASATNSMPLGICIMQGDGNLVIYAPGVHPLWASNTWQNPGSRLIVQNDGNVVIYRPDGTPVWATNTVQP